MGRSRAPQRDPGGRWRTWSILRRAYGLIQQRWAATGRARHWARDLFAGAAAALTAITVAHAALPDHINPLATRAVSAPAAPVAAPVAAPEAPPAPPPALLSFGEPVPGYQINSPWGLRKLPWEGHGRLHEGVDIAAPIGEPVVAVADGVVVRAGDSASYGRFVEVKHAEGLSSFYAHMGKLAATARAGQAVKAGTEVGRIGSSGTSTGPHLHFEVRDADGDPLNPAYFIDRHFATAEELPLRRAAYVSPTVRVAQVSHIPDSKRGLMASRGKDGRIRGVVDLDG